MAASSMLRRGLAAVSRVGVGFAVTAGLASNARRGTIASAVRTDATPAFHSTAGGAGGVVDSKTDHAGACNLGDSPGAWRRGLVGPGATDVCFTDALDFVDATRIVEEPGYLWKAAEADAAALGTPTVAYVESVLKMAGTGLEPTTELGPTWATLRNLAAGHGMLALVTGNPSLVSFLVRQAASAVAEGAPKRHVVVYNGIEHADNVAKGLLHAIVDQQPEEFARAVLARLQLKVPRSALGWLLGSLDVPNARAAFVRDAKAVVDEYAWATFCSSKCVSALDALVQTSAERGGLPCVFILGTDGALVYGSASSPFGDAMTTMSHMSQLNKQLNVFVASPGPSKLERLNATMGTNAWNTTVAAGEVAPKEMRDVLSKNWGAGPNLADACMSVWGGNVSSITSGLELLLAQRESFTALQNLAAFPPVDVQSALNCCKGSALTRLSGGDKDVLGLLRAAARQGSVPLSGASLASAAECSKNDVLTIVRAQELATHMPRTAMTGVDAVAVPSSQAMRLLLARALQRTQRA